MITEEAFRELKKIFLAFLLLIKIMPLQCSKEFVFMRERDREKKKNGDAIVRMCQSYHQKTLFRFE